MHAFTEQGRQAGRVESSAWGAWHADCAQGRSAGGGQGMACRKGGCRDDGRLDSWLLSRIGGRRECAGDMDRSGHLDATTCSAPTYALSRQAGAAQAGGG
eukprot:1159686-Pelagomonas_calceolata.AAC.1